MNGEIARMATIVISYKQCHLDRSDAIREAEGIAEWRDPVFRESYQGTHSCVP